MARVVRRAASASTRHGPSRAMQRRARRHKVIMESVTQEKKKLQSVISFEAEAPSGYTFIPAGNPLLTSACKERCRNEGLQVYAVSTTPHIKTHNLSQHVHRIGYHFPSTVVAMACSELGLYLTNTGKAVPFHTLGTAQNHPPAESEVSQITINTEARDAIKDLFPNIPQHDLFQIIKTAFQKGQRRVGTATELPLARRAQLAVVAHIRHLYTDYDRLLKLKSFHEARSAVEQATLAKVIEWRGDDENGQTVLEDVFREVIVISDDDDSETEEGVARTDTHEQDAQISLGDPRTHEIHVQPVSTAQLSRPGSLQDSSEEAPPGFRIVSKAPAERAGDRRGFSRYQAWNRALNRYRTEAQNTMAPLGDGSAERRSPRYAKRPAVVQESADPARRWDTAPQFLDTVHKTTREPILGDVSRQRAPVPLAVDRLSDTNHVGAQERHYHMEKQQAYPKFGPNELPPVLTAQKPRDVRQLEDPPRSGPDALFPPESSRPGQRANVPFGRLPQPVFVNRLKELHFGNETQTERGTDAPPSSRPKPGIAPSDYVLPSVENSWPLENRPAEGHLERQTQRLSLRSVTPVRRQGDNFQHAHVSMPDSPNGQNPKRRRLNHYAAPHRNTRLDVREANPPGLPISQGLSPRGHYRRDELVPEPRSQNGTHLGLCYPSAVNQPSLPGIYEEKPPVSFVPPQASMGAREVIDLTHVVDSPSHVSAHHSQPDLPGIGSSNVASERVFRTAEFSRSDRAFHGDCSPHTDRARPSVAERSHAFLWKPVNGHHLITGASADGRLYADGFVRPVDIQEVRPVQHYVEHSGPLAQNAGEKLNQAMRTGVSSHYVSEDLQPHAPMSEQRQPSGAAWMTQIFHNKASHRPEDTFQGQRTDHSSRQGRPGNGFSVSRHLRGPRSFEMLAQNRPVYVQQVESRAPPYAVSHGRHVVIVD